MDYKRIHAQRQAELDEELLRWLHAEQARLENRLKLMLNEIEGAQRIITEYQQHILETQLLVSEVRTTLEDLDTQESEIMSDRAHWQQKLAS